MRTIFILMVYPIINPTLLALVRLWIKKVLGLEKFALVNKATDSGADIYIIDSKNNKRKQEMVKEILKVTKLANK